MNQNTENLAEAPKKQMATSLFKMFAGSLPASILLAIGSTWLLYHAGLPERVAETYTPQIWAACLTGGAASTVASAVGLAKRSLDLTGAKIANASVVAAPSTATPDAPDVASDVPTLRPLPSQQYIDNHSEPENPNVEVLSDED